MTGPFPNVPRRRRFVSVATFRRSGAQVATPLWFGWLDDGIVVVTPANAGKVKRIRNDPHALVAPCRSQGKLTGAAAEATAEVVSNARRRAAGRAIARRYLVPAAVLEWEMRRRGGGAEPVYLRLVPT